MLIASLLCVALLAVSLAHFAWALGQTWPLRDEKLLAKTVTGLAGREKMPPRLISLAIAIFTFAASVWALALADHSGGGLSLSVIGSVLAIIFLARGIVGYAPAWQAFTPEEPFRSYDLKLYSPLCLLLGLGFLALVVLRLV